MDIDLIYNIARESGVTPDFTTHDVLIGAKLIERGGALTKKSKALVNSVANPLELLEALADLTLQHDYGTGMNVRTISKTAGDITGSDADKSQKLIAGIHASCKRLMHKRAKFEQTVNQLHRGH